MYLDEFTIPNSEARRHNALIRSNALDEPLTPLVRPFARPFPSFPAAEPVTRRLSDTTTATLNPPSASDAAANGDPTDAATVPIIDVSEESPTVDAAAPAEIVLEPPTPSPLFPRDLTSLMRLNPDDATALVREYGLEPLQIPEYSSLGEGFEAAKKEPQSSREENLNRFLSHIGVSVLMHRYVSGILINYRPGWFPIGLRTFNLAKSS